MLCGLSVPSLRLLWGAVRNRQLYILRMYCTGCISFNFSIFFIIYTTYRKKKLHTLTAKKEIQFLFYNSHDLPQKKNYTHLLQKKNYTARRFFCTQLTFFTWGWDGRLSAAGKGMAKALHGVQGDWATEPPSSCSSARGDIPGQGAWDLAHSQSTQSPPLPTFLSPLSRRGIQNMFQDTPLQSIPISQKVMQSAGWGGL